MGVKNIRYYSSKKIYRDNEIISPVSKKVVYISTCMWIITSDKGKRVTVLISMNCSHLCGKKSGLPFHYFPVEANEMNTSGGGIWLERRGSQKEGIPSVKAVSGTTVGAGEKAGI
jgi:hypothetical protein